MHFSKKDFFRLFLAIAAFALGSPAFAQELGYGFRAGVNFPSYSLSNNFSAGSTVNFQVGAFVDVPLVGDFLSLQPGLSLQGKGAAGGEWFFNAGEPNDPALDDFKQNTMWLDIPVNVVGKLQIPAGGFVFAGLGPYLGFGLSGKNTIDGEEITEQGSGFKFGRDDSLRGLDYGVNFSLGYQLPLGVHLVGGYGLGLANLAPRNEFNYNHTQKNSVWSISLGYSL
ncbi:Outer membrane protein beta-barrel domain-containing protein [Parapedobacter composti]|uniref:Outer membrane protein beta-barrel domain-containing protein n=1 Tax=Parapedobacter composti TaxID=623281 RepID=A0A1I1FXM0_9SPHI|nr:porin family protein [Parapedobacter composti]SFC04011.1 Outer membrane protein beta-barrel domain-containing protein [Parapedobacter composti]